MNFPQMMGCIVCYSSLVAVIIFNQTKMCSKGLVSCLKNNDIITLKKHVHANHGLNGRKIEKRVNNNMKIPMGNQFAKKRPRTISLNTLSNF
jgi:hypothetical protein